LRRYEMMYILHPQLSDEDLTTTIDQISRFVTTLGGEVTQVIREAPWGRRRMAYTIRHNGQDLRDGFYVLTYFTMESSRRLGELERGLNLNDRVVRYLVVKDERPVPAPEPVAAS
jgi:small subunit ribosomal protein S6